MKALPTSVLIESVGRFCEFESESLFVCKSWLLLQILNPVCSLVSLLSKCRESEDPSRCCDNRIASWSSGGPPSIEVFPGMMRLIKTTGLKLSFRGLSNDVDTASSQIRFRVLPLCRSPRCCRFDHRLNCYHGRESPQYTAVARRCWECISAASHRHLMLIPRNDSQVTSWLVHTRERRTR